ncbi:ester cyclase [Aquimarina megaterium]|uniref:ester cyclase n=1 Tax=Aquimarina megaterium TaxID=1443666 RepID=UPI0004710524|nr:ester cyclase [Aquimarina megaterium]
MNKESFLREFMTEIWNKKKFDKVEQYVHPEYTIHLDTADPWEGKTLSHSEFKERLNFSFNSFPDMNFEITSAISEENHVVITWILTGTNLGMIGEFPPTKKTINTKGITIYHFKNNLINGHTQVFDRITVMKQLGFM